MKVNQGILFSDLDRSKQNSLNEYQGKTRFISDSTISLPGASDQRRARKIRDDQEWVRIPMSLQGLQTVLNAHSGGVRGQ